MDENRIAYLLRGMTVLLKMYETELTAYHQAYGMIDKEAQKAGITLDISQALESLAIAPATRKEVDDMYAPIEQLARSMTPENLNLATVAIERIQKLRGVVRVNLPQTEPKGPIQ